MKLLGYRESSQKRKHLLTGCQINQMSRSSDTRLSHVPDAFIASVPYQSCVALSRARQILSFLFDPQLPHQEPTKLQSDTHNFS